MYDVLSGSSPAGCTPNRIAVKLGLDDGYDYRGYALILMLITLSMLASSML
jgi:hypothetical protein